MKNQGIIRESAKPTKPGSTAAIPHDLRALFMRIHGTLAKWNDDRGFGFTEPTVGTEQLFVHIYAFPRDGIRPRIGELASFEMDLRGDGKKRAVRVMRPGSPNSSPPANPARPVRHDDRFGTAGRHRLL